MSDRSFDSAIAIVGMHCRVPGASGCDALWSNLRDGVESITRFSDEELLRAGVDAAVLRDPDYVKARAILDDIDQFDAEHFGYTPREAELLDPQQRLFLECAWQSMELCGCLGDRDERRVGVFAGCGANGYLLHNLVGDPEVRALDHYKLAISTERDFVATRVSYKLNLHGPSLSIATACSTSLVAVHMACQSLLNGECDVALAGGVSIPIPHRQGYHYLEGGVLSPDGHCRAFDAGARGTAVGSGAAIVVLQRYAEAVAHGHRIHAVILGTNINNDGALKAGFTAPSVPGQAEAIYDALALSGVDAGTIGYVETHGTGTQLGDPIEIAALTKAFRAAGAKRDGTCAIGSIKTNLGHLDAAAGAIGLIKAALVLQHREIPPSLNFSRPNPEIDFEHSPFYVNTTLVPWQSETPLRAGVSSFGLGGTNAHAILEEAPEQEPAVPSARLWQIVPVSAKTPAALQESSAGIDRFLADNVASIADAAFTVAVGRRSFAHRRALIVPADASEEYHAVSGEALEGGRNVVFLFPGGGAQHTGMGRELYQSEPRYREALDRCADILSLDVRDLIEAEPVRMASPLFGLPALFSTEYALAKLWMSWGVQPRGMIGHSLGEYVAACIGGVLSLQEALALVAGRSALFERLPEGAMLSVKVAESEIAPLLGDELSIAAVNGPTSCVVSGPLDAAAALEERLRERGIDVRRLRLAVAAHSKLVTGILDPFRRLLNTLQFHSPMIPWVSNLTGTWITAAQATDPDYWCRHLRETVRFGDGVCTLFDDASSFLLEVGPGQTLTNLVLQHPARAATQPVAASLPHPEEPQSDSGVLLTTLGRLWTSGVPVDWPAFYAGEERRRIELPTYPFQRHRYWIDPAATAAPRSKTIEVPGESTMTESSNARHADVVAALKRIVTKISGIPAERIDERQTFFALGLDSLTLVQVSRVVKSEFGVKLTMRNLLEELSTLETLAQKIEKEVPVEGPVNAPAIDPLPQVAAPIASGAVERIAQQQLEVMRMQLEMLKGGVPERRQEPLAPLVAPTAHHNKPLHFSPTTDTSERGLTPVQRRHLDALVARYTAHTRRSKEYAQRYRAVLADSRGSVGFRLITKELLYPIVGTRASGSHLWDLDGNEYIDLTNAFGVTLFGHQPQFVADALREHSDRALILGPRSPDAGEAAELIAEMTGMRRVTFCNSGTEAIMAAIRLARTATGRARIVVFDGAYHGHSDQTLLQGGLRDGRLIGEPMSPGIPPEVLHNTIALEYGTEESLDYIRRHGDSIAAVLVEPVQSMRLDFQPAAFLRTLRDVTRRSGTALIFDEMITGFRVHPGGAQAFFGVEADLACYGKIIGGGLPIGVVAGRAELMDGIDGGVWSFGDASFPAAERTFFGGTFCQHPQTMIAAVAVLKELKRRGPALQENLNRRTHDFVTELNRSFDAEELPIHIAHFSSAFRFAFKANVELLFFHLIEKGVYTWEWRGCFLTDAHTDADLARVRDAIGETIDDLRAGEFLAKRPAPRIAEVPLTAAQKQLWLLSQSHESGSLAYKTALALKLIGILDIERLRDAVRRLVARHDALRTVIDPGGECQHVASRVDTNVDVIDCSGDAAAVDRWFDEKNRQPMDLATGPLFLVHLLRVDAGAHLLVLTAHHVILDGWSMTNVVSELMALYDGAVTLDPKPMQFRDYVRWQQEFLRGEEAAAQETFWLEQLREPTKAIDACFDRLRPRSRSYASRRHTTRIDAAAIRRFCSEKNCTLFMALYAAWAALLHRVSGESDLLIGVPASGRSLEGSDSLVGYCTHILPVRNHIDAAGSFADFLGATRESLLAAYGNQDVPFAVLLNLLGLKRDVSQAPLVSLTFNLDRPVPMPKVRGLDIELATHPVAFSDFDLMVNVIDLGDDLVIECNASSDVFSDTTVDRILRAYRTLLTAAVATPEESLSRLLLLTAEERGRIVADSAPREITAPARCIHELFEEQAARNPQSIAVTFEGENVTYRELNELANRLAHHIRGRGVVAGELVGICAEPSVEMIAGILGILKAGGAYVPLDPAYPEERLAMLREDSGVRIVISQTLPDLASEPVTNPVNVTKPADAAYVIYTSGSTGRPKGVVVQHDNVVRLFTSTDDWYHFNTDDVWTVFHSFAFDFSVWEIFGALLYGGRLVVVPYWITRNPDAFHRLVSDERVTVLNQTPSAFRYFAQADANASANPSSLRLVIFGGEALNAAALLPWFERHGDVRPQLVNMYGITETTVHVTYKPLTRPDAECGSSSIGIPIPDLQLYLLDRHGEPVPPGVVGEIHVGGAGVTRGYLRRDDLTAQRFIANPFVDGARLYRSGDLGRRNEVGEIEYRGRADEQIKVRGFRIEPAEIEAVLAMHPAVRDVVVANKAGQLMAWFVSQEPPSAAELRAWAAKRLADYMVPSAFVATSALPLTRNGKVDRAALPLPAELNPPEIAHTAPRNDVEESLARIWGDLLCIEQVGVHDNFFELGGDSIIAMQVATRATQAGFPITVRDVHRQPTIAELAGVVTIPLTPIQRWFFDQPHAEPQHHNMALLLEIAGDTDVAALQRALNAVVQHHEALRLTFTRNGAGWRQDVAAGMPPLRLVEADGAALERIAGETQASFGALEAPLVRAVLFRNPSRLLLVIHHLCIDGVSWRIVLDDLRTAYAQIARGNEIALPPNGGSLRDWSVRAASNGNGFDCGDAGLLLPGSAEAPNLVADEGHIVSSLDADDTRALLQQVPRSLGARIDDVLLAALGSALQRWLGSGSVLIDVEGHGREADAGMDRAVGWFTSIHPIRLAIRDEPPLLPLLDQVRRWRERVPRTGVAAASQILFNYLGQFDHALSGGFIVGLAAESCGPTRSPRSARSHLLEINAHVSGSRLHVTWGFNSTLHDHGTITSVVHAFRVAIDAFVTSCRSTHGAEPMVSAFASVN